MIFVRSWPARPTNGSPCASSSAPGASPTNINSARGLPTPKTTCVREATKCGQRVQERMTGRRESSVSDVALRELEVVGVLEVEIGVSTVGATGVAERRRSSARVVAGQRVLRFFMAASVGITLASACWKSSGIVEDYIMIRQTSPNVMLHPLYIHIHYSLSLRYTCVLL